MDIRYLVPISAVIILALSWTIIKQGGKNPLNRSFVIFSLLVAAWGISLFFYEFPIFFSDRIWIKIVYLISFPLAPSFFYFANVFSQDSPKNAKLPIAIYTILVLPLIYSLFFTNLFVKDVVNHQTIVGPVYPFLGVIGGGYFLWGLIKLIRKYFKTKGIIQTQIQYFLLGMSLFASGAIVVDIILPLSGKGSSLFWLSPVFSLFLVISTSYAITRYRLMDVRFVIGRGIIYLFSFVAVVGLTLVLLFLNEKLIEPVPTNIAASSILVAGILLFQPIFRFFEKLASKYFYYTFYSYQKVLADLGRKLTQVLELDKLSSSIVSTLINTMKLDRTVILLREPGNGDYRIQTNIGFREENGISLVKDNFLTVWLEKTQKPLVQEEISLLLKDVSDKKEGARLEKLRNNMKKIEAALCLPLLIEEKIIGMIVLGNKISKDPYSQQDIELLTSLSNQASIALQNAKLYSEIKGFNINLEKEVEKRTKELSDAYEELKKLDKAKSEFVSIASHQLRTPLTAIKGYISMILENSYGKLSAKLKKPIENIYTSNERLIRLVNDLLNVSRIEAGRTELKREEASITELVSSIIDELKNNAGQKGIYLKLEKTKNGSKNISIDKSKMRQVIMNIIDNAIRYTEKGGITVRCAAQDKKYKIEIKDTGEGMTKDEMGDLFESFSRGKAGTRFWTEGAGLGLYVAKKFVDMHNGKIWAESQGKGKGSTFHIELPIK